MAFSSRITLPYNSGVCSKIRKGIKNRQFVKRRTWEWQLEPEVRHKGSSTQMDWKRQRRSNSLFSHNMKKLGENQWNNQSKKESMFSCTTSFSCGTHVMDCFWCQIIRGLKREEAVMADNVVRAGRAPGWRQPAGESLEKASASWCTPSASFSWSNNHQLLSERDGSVMSEKQSIKEGVSGKGVGCPCPLCLIPANCRWCLGSESSAALRDWHRPPAPFQSKTPRTAVRFSQLSGGSASGGLSAQRCCCLF